LPHPCAVAGWYAGRDDLHLRETGLVFDHRVVERFDAGRAQDACVRPAGGAADLGAGWLRDRVPGAGCGGGRVPALVAAEGRLLAAGAEPIAKSDARRTAQRTAAEPLATPAGAAGKGDPGDDERRLRRHLAPGLAGLENASRRSRGIGPAPLQPSPPASSPGAQAPDPAPAPRWRPAPARP